MSLLSVIVPCYNEEESVALLYEELLKNEPFFQEHQIELELLYINDGSRDRTVEEVKKLHEKDSRVHLVSFPEILERRLPCMPDWNIPKAITWL